MSNLWFELYRPKTIDEIILSSQELKKIKSWILDIKNNKKDTPLCLFLHGSPGVGKTTLAHCVLSYGNYEVAELNASELRNAKAIKSRIEEYMGSVNVSSLMCQKKQFIGIIMDEIDGMSSGDRGGIGEITEFILKKNTYKHKTPFICISNTTDKKLKALRQKSLDICIKEPTKQGLQILAQRVIKNEDLIDDPLILQKVIQHSQNDYRRLLNIMEYLWSNNKKKEFELDELDEILQNYDKKKKHLTCYQSTDKILNLPLSLNQSLGYFYEEPLMTHMLCYENAITHLIKNRKYDKNTAQNAFELYDSISQSSYYEEGIYKNQTWCLNDYIGLHSCAITNYIMHHKTDKFSCSRYTNLQYSTSMNKMSHDSLQTKLRDEFMKKVCSFSNIKDYSLFADIIMAKCISGNWEEVYEMFDYYKITYEDFEKRICKWSSLPSKSFLTSSKKKELKQYLKKHEIKD